MAIILDADVLIRGEKGTLDLKGWLATYPNDRLEVAAITVAELWHGVERSTAPRHPAFSPKTAPLVVSKQALRRWTG